MADDTDTYGAIVAKRRLARRVAEMRVRAGMSLNEASDKLGWSRGRWTGTSGTSGGSRIPVTSATGPDLWRQ